MKTSTYVKFIVSRKCNNNCVICMIDWMGPKLKTIALNDFKKQLSLYKGEYEGVIFSGREVTLNKQLPLYAAYAKASGFRNIMIETNGRALADLHIARELQAAGINEYFVSFHSADPALSRKITRRKNAFTETLKALENLDKLDMTIITNTVMNSLNFSSLPQIAKILLSFQKIKEAQFWGYWPMSRFSSKLLLPYASAAPYLNEALKMLLAKNKSVCVKFFPPCYLLKNHRKYLDNDLSLTTGLEDSFWERFGKLNFERCPDCGDNRCDGLPEDSRVSGLTKDHYKR